MRLIYVFCGMIVVFLVSIVVFGYAYCTGWFIVSSELVNVTSGWNIEGQKYLHYGKGKQKRQYYEDWYNNQGFNNQLPPRGDYVADDNITIFGYGIRRTMFVVGGDSSFTVGYQMNFLSR